MNTNELIAALAADRTRQPPTARVLATGLLVALVLSLVIYALALGPRPGLAGLLATPRVQFKLLWTAALAAAATGMLLRLASPGRRPALAALALAAVLAALGVAVGVELAVVPESQWAEAARGGNATWCLRMIPLLATAPLAAALWALRRAAPTRPAAAGAIAGLLAGALGAAIYATHCPDDSPLFVASWYGLAILGMALLGGAVGSRWLRW